MMFTWQMINSLATQPVWLLTTFNLHYLTFSSTSLYALWKMSFPSLSQRRDRAEITRCGVSMITWYPAKLDP